MTSDDQTRPRILIADDSPTVIGILGYIFGEEGWTVESAADGVEALQRFYSSPPDLVVLDIGMPRMNGYQVCRVIKDDPQAEGVPVIVLTSRDLQSDRFQGIAAGADAYIVKNLEDDRLLQTVRRYLGEREAAGATRMKPQAIGDAEILQTVNRMLDRRLFISTVTSQVEQVNAQVMDYAAARREIVDLFSRVFEFVVGGIALNGPQGFDLTVTLLDDFPDSVAEAFAGALLEKACAEIPDVRPELGDRIIARHTAGGSRQFPESSEMIDRVFWLFHSGGRVVGVMGMAGSAPLKFDQEGRELAQEFIRRAEIVLDNARLVELKERSNRDLAAALKELKETQAQLVHTEKMASLGQLMAGLTHEMNNPLNFIAGNLEHLDSYTRDLFQLADACLETPAAKEEAVERLRGEMDYDFRREDFPGLLRDLREGVARARRIISDLRTFSAQDREGTAPTDLAAIIESTLNILRHEWELDCDIVRQIEEAPPCECHAGQIGQVVMNLLTNAICAVKESGRRGRIEVVLKEIGNSTELSVSDNGVGIAPENVQRLFQPFFTTRDVGKGMGLGLSISYGIVRRHGGDITVHSEPGVGSTFTVRLPHHN